MLEITLTNLLMANIDRAFFTKWLLSLILYVYQIEVIVTLSLGLRDFVNSTFIISSKFF